MGRRHALEVVSTPDDLDELLAIATDRSYGSDRQMVVHGLGRFKDERVTAALIRLLDDAPVRGHAVAALGRLKDPRARDALEAHAGDEKAWVRREVAKALAKLR